MTLTEKQPHPFLGAAVLAVFRFFIRVLRRVTVVDGHIQNSSIEVFPEKIALKGVLEETVNDRHPFPKPRSTDRLPGMYLASY